MVKTCTAYAVRFICCLPFLLFCNNCTSKISEYAFCAAVVCDEGCWIDQNADRIYKAGDQYYIKAQRGRIRGAQRGWPAGDVFSGFKTMKTWVPDDNSPENIYALLDVHGAAMCLYDTTLNKESNPSEWHPVLSLRYDSILYSTLPENAVTIPFQANVEISDEAWGISQPREDWRGIYLYPTGALIWLTVDVPCTILGSFLYVLYQTTTAM